MDYAIRHIRPNEWPLLADFLYEAIYVPEGFDGEIPRSVIYSDPRCLAAHQGFGSLPDDRALVAEVDGGVIGACWVRTTEEYGHIDETTPSFSLSLYEPYRGNGIGGALMHAMLNELCDAGYARTSLSVQKANPALHLYERLGFRIVGYGVDESEWLMIRKLDRSVASTPLAFRRLTMEDVPTFIELRRAQLLEEGAVETCDLRPTLFDYYERHLTDESFVSWIALLDDRIVATSGLSIVEKPPYFGCPTGRIGLISSMWVHDELRRQGIARDLLLRIIDEAKASSCAVLQITASDMGVHLYSSCGFSHHANFMQLTL